MWQKQSHKSSFRESIKALEADLQHANTLAASLPRDYDGDYIQMKLSYSPFAPFLLFLIEWMDCTCTDSLPGYFGLLHVLINKVYVDGMPTMSSQERRATLREFYAVIYPLLKQLEDDTIELEDENERTRNSEMLNRQRVEGKGKHFVKDPERDDECGICMETSTKMVLPNCGHSMCNVCFHDWNVRSQSCPFCRGSLKRIDSRDLWVLTSNSDVVDAITLAKENLTRFYLFIENLPLTMPDSHLFLYDYLI
ncbi:E3 ubiquitin-protein ligase AIRP2-like [Cornus florida]|uniref:E3 ubiquitin-protein ligase AIRP2-like n=1 Tax=Cornus florida TaxID=4283 RepID=UPI0028970D35|nr:E3 ubiquitin-protein ligase AIRP2-like [Cornus florida]